MDRAAALAPDAAARACRSARNEIVVDPRVGEAAYVAIIWVAAIAILLLRRPDALVLPQMVNEDGARFYLDALLGRSILEPYAGYLHFVPRLGMAVIAAFPVAVAPLLSNMLAVAIQAGVAAYLASDALASTIPSRPFRLAIAALFVVLPATDELVGRLYNAQWGLAAFLVAASLASHIGRGGRVALLFAGLSGPFSALLAPLYWLRGRRTADWFPAVIVTACGVGQAVVFLVSARPAGGHPGADVIVQAVVRRGNVEPFTGAVAVDGLFGVPMQLAALAIGFTVLVVLAARSLPRLPVLTVLYAGGVVMVAGLLATGDTASNLLHGWPAARYFVLWILALELIAIAAVRRSYAGVALTVLVGVAIIGDFRLPALPDEHWSSAAGCLKGAEPCSVPIPWTTTIEWPGH